MGRVIVAGHWEIGYMTPIMEANFWALPLRDFGIEEWCMTPVSGILNNEQKRVTLKEFHTYDDMIAAAGDIPRVFIEPRSKSNKDTIWLHEFNHPEECIYIFGSAHYNPTIRHCREDDFVVSIKTKDDKGVLWSNQCSGLVLYDRMVKSWQ